MRKRKPMMNMFLDNSGRLQNQTIDLDVDCFQKSLTISSDEDFSLV